ncbi:MAG TPA: B12-binding domain-containing radical SAM protein, partial [Anaerolineae bacterium]
MSRWQQVSGAEAVLERELGTIFKDPGGKLRVALAYPNTYYVGMSSLALHILYRAFNARPDVACERAFWDPAAAKRGTPLIALESQADLAAFDVWAFTVSFEMDYFHIAAMLAQAGVPLLAEERRRSSGEPATRRGAAVAEARWPLLIAGGPAVTMNPEVLAPFFDAIVIGEGEEVLDPLTDTLAAGINEDRDQLLAALS